MWTVWSVNKEYDPSPNLMGIASTEQKADEMVELLQEQIGEPLQFYKENMEVDTVTIKSVQGNKTFRV